jgi:hypothetical protein
VASGSGQFKKVQNALATVVVLGAFSALVFQSKIEDWWEHRALSHDRRPIIGHIESIKGEVKYRKPESLTPIRVQAGMNLHPEDSILTDDNETAIISFNSGLKVQLEPHSTIVITDADPEMVFLKGRVKVLDEVAGITLPPDVLSKDTVEEKTEIKTPEAMPVLKTPEAPKTVYRPNKKTDDNVTLPDAYISGVIKNQRTFLNRCYAQHLRNDPDTQGRIDTSLTIELDGSVSAARVVGSTIADTQLQQCIVSTLQRTKFRAFGGDPMVVYYPITFD